jgi:hypothetical protein
MGRTGFGWLRIGSGGGLLWTRWWTFGFRKKTGYFLMSWVTISFSNNILHHGVSEWVSEWVSKCLCTAFSRTFPSTWTVWGNVLTFAVSINANVWVGFHNAANRVSYWHLLRVNGSAFHD